MSLVVSTTFSDVHFALSVPYVSSSNHIVYITVHPSKKGVRNISTKHLQILIKHPLPFWGTNSEAPNNAILIMYIK